MRPSQTILVLEALRNKFSGPLYRKGVRLSLEDRQTVLDVYQQWLALMIDLGYLHHVTLERDARRLLTTMLEVDVLSLNNAFTDLLHLTRCQSNKGFKALCREVSPHLYDIVKDDMDRLLKGDVFAAKRLMQAFAYTSRLTLDDIDLTDQCLTSYMEIEDNMSTYLPKAMLSSLNSIIKRWMKSFDPDRIHCGHGPGGVAGHGKTALEMKYKDLTSDALLSYAFGDPLWVQSPIPSTMDRISHTIFVAKSYKTFRTISMEPTTLQYKQQGVLREIDRVITSSRYLRSHIDTHYQPRNQLLAKEGSLNRNFATIDLSAASDSVSYSLVKELFRGTKLLRYLVATRSSKTLLPDGRLIDLKKFAPMGSALCFPIQTIIFASICQYVTREHGVTADYSVYGDDIIVPTQCAEDVILILNLLGFSVNTEKSFYEPECWFRESCGAEYCDGFDVTPMKVGRKYRNNEQYVHPNHLIKASNKAYAKGFSNLRYFFLKRLRHREHVVLFSPQGAHSDNYSNYHTRRMWDKNLQKVLVEATGFKQKKTSEDEPTRLRHWLESTHGRIAYHEAFTAFVGKVTMYPENQWFNKSYEPEDQGFIDYFTIERANRFPLKL